MGGHPRRHDRPLASGRRHRLGASLARVGFEDSTCRAPGRAVTRNVALVGKLAKLVRLLGCEVATPAEARKILGIR